MKDTIKLGAILFLITAVCAGLLGFVNSITSPIIKEKKEISKQEAMKILLSEAEAFSQVTEIEEANIKELYLATKGENYLGAVVKVTPEGYGGAIEMLIGIDKNSAVTGVQILSHAETPGLGANLQNDSFKAQFVGKQGTLEVVKGAAGEGEISAITGATITSRAVTVGVNLALEYINAHGEALIGGVK